MEKTFLNPHARNYQLYFKLDEFFRKTAIQRQRAYLRNCPRRKNQSSFDGGVDESRKLAPYNFKRLGHLFFALAKQNLEKRRNFRTFARSGFNFGRLRL